MRVLVKLLVLAAAVVAAKWVYENFLAPPQPIAELRPEHEPPVSAPDGPGITFRSVARTE